MLPTATLFSRNKLKHRLRLAKRKDLGDIAMNATAYDVLSIEEVMKHLLVKFITIPANNYGNSEKKKDLTVNFVH